MLSFCANHENDLREIAKNCVNAFPDVKLWLLNGQLGAGKTALVKAFCAFLRVIDDVSSPTFGLVNEYITEDHKQVFHFDLYRVEEQIELLRMGIEEYVDNDAYCFFEWADLVEQLLPAPYCKIDIELNENLSRNINVVKYG